MEGRKLSRKKGMKGRRKQKGRRVAVSEGSGGSEGGGKGWRTERREVRKKWPRELGGRNGRRTVGSGTR